MPYQRSSYKLGQRIELVGSSAKLFLGDGRPGQRTVLELSGNRFSNADPIVFAPADLDDTTLGGSNVDWGCHLNWELNGKIATSTPTGSDKAILPWDATDTPYTINIPKNSQCSGIFEYSRRSVQRSCRESASDTLPLLNLNYNGRGERGCSSAMDFNSRDSSRYTQSTCNDFQNVTLNGDLYQVYTSGARKGQAYKVLGDGLLENQTDSVDSEIDPATGDVTFPDMASVDASSGSSDDGSGNMIIIVVVVAVVIILIIVVVVMIQVKKTSQGNVRDTGTVSFENPMYDDAGQNGDANNNGLYDQPDIGGSSGYMDVPAGDAGGAGSGYMDVAPGDGGASGYMDVSPEADDGTFGAADEDDDDGDI